MNRTCDLFVVGAGPAGATAARVAAQAGLSVALIDRHRFPRDKVCGGLLSQRAQRALGCALPPSLVQASPRGIRLVSECGHEIVARAREPVGQMVSRREFDAYLLERAVGAGARFYPATMIGGLSALPGGRVCVETTAGTWEAGHVIGADGAFSTTGLLAGIRRGWSDWEHGFGLSLTLPTGASGTEQVGDVVELHLQPVFCGLGWVFPLRNGVTVGLAGLAVERYQVALQFDRFLRFVLGRLRLPAPQARPRAWYLPAGGRSRRIARGRVLLAGDAAGLVDPLAGEGLHAALTSGRLAAEAVISAAASPAGAGAAARAYTEAVRREFLRDQRAAAALAFILGRKGPFVFDVLRHNPALTNHLLAAMTDGNCWSAALRDALLNWPLYCLAALLARQRVADEQVVFERQE